MKTVSAKHNLIREKTNCVADMSGKGKQRYERDSALAGRDQVSLIFLTAQGNQQHKEIL